MRALIFVLLAVALGCAEIKGVEESGGRAVATKRGRPAAGKSAAVAGEDWPQWRGPRADGISRETAWRAKWPEAGPKQLWKQAVGVGFSSVSVADGRLYTMGHESADDTVYCFNANTGKSLWKHSYPCALVDNLHEGGPAATPTVDGPRVFTLSKEGHLFAFDRKTGKVLWKLDLQPLLEVKMPDWGFSCSPLVLGEKLIVEAGRTIALDKATGKLIWQTKAYRPGYGSPTLMQHNGETLIVTLNNDNLLVVRADTGEEVDQFSWQTDFATSASTPIVVDDKIFISTGYNKGCALFALKDGKLGQLYHNKRMRNHMSNCVLWEGHVYGFDGNSHNARLVNLVCMDLATGQVKWKENGLGCGSLMLAADKLIVLSDEGELLTAPATPDAFTPISRSQVLEGRCWSVPVLSHAKIYCRNAPGDLVCLDVSE